MLLPYQLSPNSVPGAVFTGFSHQGVCHSVKVLNKAQTDNPQTHFTQQWSNPDIHFFCNIHFLVGVHVARLSRKHLRVKVREETEFKCNGNYKFNIRTVRFVFILSAGEADFHWNCSVNFLSVFPVPVKQTEKL